MNLPVCPGTHEDVARFGNATCPLCGRPAFAHPKKSAPIVLRADPDSRHLYDEALRADPALAAVFSIEERALSPDELRAIELRAISAKDPASAGAVTREFMALQKGQETLRALREKVAGRE